MPSSNRARAGTALLSATILIVLMTGTMFALTSNCIANHQTEKQGFQDKELQVSAEGVMYNAYAQVAATPTILASATLTTPFALTLSSMSSYANYGSTHTSSPTKCNNVYVYAYLIEQSTTNYQIEAIASRVPLTFSSGVSATTGLMTYALPSGTTPSYQGQYDRRAVMNLAVTAGTTTVYGFGAGLFSAGTMTFTGNTTTDGWNSNSGTYAATKNTTGGSIGSNSNISLTGSMNVGGNVSTPGNFSVTGSTTIHDNINVGPGKTVTNTGGTLDGTTTYTQTPVTIAPLTITTPSTNNNANLSGNSWWGGGTPSMTGNFTVAVPGGTYVMGGMTGTGTETFNISGNVNLYFSGNVSFTGSAIFNLAAGAHLQIFQTAGSFSMTGSSAINDNNAAPIPADFNFWSTSSGAITVTGSTATYGTIYAPNTSGVTVTGTSGWYGSVVSGGTLSLTGGTPLHYDQALANSVPLPNSAASTPTATFNGWSMW
jgi:hypothetical protein